LHTQTAVGVVWNVALWDKDDKL